MGKVREVVQLPSKDSAALSLGVMRSRDPRSRLFLNLQPYRLALQVSARANTHLFLIVTLCRENLSSGENLAGWADLVTFPVGVTFYSQDTNHKRCKIQGQRLFNTPIKGNATGRVHLLRSLGF